MDKTKSKELFLHFLKTVRVDGKRLYKRWMENFNLIRSDYPDYGSFLNDADYYKYIVSVFTWDETTEGYYFWDRVDEKWRKYLEKYA